MSFLTRLSLRPTRAAFSANSMLPIAGPSRLPATATATAFTGMTASSSSVLTSSFSTSSALMVKQKLKSHSGCKKRFFPNASGMFKRAQTGKAHLNTAFSTARINRLAKQVYTTKTQSKLLRKLLPYA
ncbi:ribosomal protein L35 [Kwoniella sp. CBS 9459]